MSAGPVRVQVCHGSDCRKRHKAFKALLAGVAGQTVVPVRCQDICSGPVVGLEINGKQQWFRKVRGEALEALLRFITKGKGRKKLWKSRMKKRSGKIRR